MDNAPTRITELGYLGFTTAKSAEWKAFGTQILGMQVSDGEARDRFYLRMDLWHHRFVVHDGDTEDIAYVGWRVPGPPELLALQAQLEQAGIPVRMASAAEAEERQVLGLLKLADPAGVPTEIFYSPRVDAHRPLHPGRPMFRKFLTGDHGMGHVMLRAPDLQAAMKFYGLLGFSGCVEYLQSLPGGGIMPSVFMHCNDRQHAIALLGGGPRNLLHFMFNYEALEDLGQTYDIAREQNCELCTSLGMHANDRALSFYMVTPSGWMIEPGWGGRLPPQQEHHVSDIFGHDLISGQHVGNIPFRLPHTPR